MAQKGIHPQYKKSVITCACGNRAETYSTRGDFMTDICSACHPFFTGKQKFIDTAGRVEKFTRKYNWGKKDADKPEGDAAQG